MIRLGLPLLALLASPWTVRAEPPVAEGTNDLGLRLLRELAKPGENLCLSPYSIREAFAMVQAGARGETLQEMRKTLGFGEANDLARAQAALATYRAKLVERLTTKTKGGKASPIEVRIANRLFGALKYEFLPDFVATCGEDFDAALERLDFVGGSEPSRKEINDWVAKQTADRIQDLLPEGSIDATTRLVLTNALYLKAPWEKAFPEQLTTEKPFHVGGAEKTEPVPMMRRTLPKLRYVKAPGYKAVGIPYLGGELQFVVLLPSRLDGLAEVTKGLDVAALSAITRAKPVPVHLSLPRFKLEGESVSLRDVLTALGMGRAFDPKTADFRGMEPRGELYLDDAFHKTFLEVDEKGTEAAAATAAVMAFRSIAVPQGEPIVFTVDRPFLFAIQDTVTGTCLFLGKVEDPR